MTKTDLTIRELAKALFTIRDDLHAGVFPTHADKLAILDHAINILDEIADAKDGGRALNPAWLDAGPMAGEDDPGRLLQRKVEFNSWPDKEERG